MTKATRSERKNRISNNNRDETGPEKIENNAGPEPLQTTHHNLRPRNQLSNWRSRSEDYFDDIPTSTLLRTTNTNNKFARFVQRMQGIVKEFKKSRSSSSRGRKFVNDLFNFVHSQVESIRLCDVEHWILLHPWIVESSKTKTKGKSTKHKSKRSRSKVSNSSVAVSTENHAMDMELEADSSVPRPLSDSAALSQRNSENMDDETANIPEAPVQMEYQDNEMHTVVNITQNDEAQEMDSGSIPEVFDETEYNTSKTPEDVALTSVMHSVMRSPFWNFFEAHQPSEVEGLHTFTAEDARAAGFYDLFFQENGSFFSPIQSPATIQSEDVHSVLEIPVPQREVQDGNRRHNALLPDLYFQMRRVFRRLASGNPSSVVELDVNPDMSFVEAAGTMSERVRDGVQIAVEINNFMACLDQRFEVAGPSSAPSNFHVPSLSNDEQQHFAELTTALKHTAIAVRLVYENNGGLRLRTSLIPYREIVQIILTNLHELILPDILMSRYPSTQLKIEPRYSPEQQLHSD